MNVPTIIGADGVEKVLEVPLYDNELESLKRSSESILEAIEGVKGL